VVMLTTSKTTTTRMLSVLACIRKSINRKCAYEFYMNRKCRMPHQHDRDRLKRVRASFCCGEVW
jgi:hypothetical protein